MDNLVFGRFWISVANIRLTDLSFRAGPSDRILCCFSGYWTTKINVKSKRQNFFNLYFHVFFEGVKIAKSHVCKGFQAIRKTTFQKHVDLPYTN